jgi:hypothetical protein
MFRKSSMTEVPEDGTRTGPGRRQKRGQQPPEQAPTQTQQNFRWSLVANTEQQEEKTILEI